MSRRSEFVDFVTEHMACIGRLRTRAMFGGYGVYHDNLIIAIIVDDRLYFKADSTARAEFEAKGLNPFTYMARGKSVTLHYFEAPPEVFEEPEAMRAWAQKAYGAALRAKNQGVALPHGIAPLLYKTTRVIKKRCAWVTADFLYRNYHDREWGKPVHDDRLLFEFLILEGAQAGLSWLTILKKRDNYRKAFDNFDARKIARYNAAKIEKLLADPGIVRNRLKITAAVQNARAFLAVQKEFGSFDNYIWRFVGGKPIKNVWKTLTQLPATTAESDALSKDLKKRGFKFVGSTICYAFMQAVGMVNDHTVHCFRHDPR